MASEISKSGSVHRNNCQDLEYISNDPAENSDNFDPKWNTIRELNTNEERYHSIRQRWKNSKIPNPNADLTYRQIINFSNIGFSDNMETKNEPYVVFESNLKKPNLNEEESTLFIEHEEGKPLKVTRRRRSRSCTTQYEKLISDLEKNYMTEYSQLMFKQKLELDEMLQMQSMEALGIFYSYPDRRNQLIPKLLEFQGEKLRHALLNQQEKVQHFMDKKAQDIEVHKRYLEEVKTFMTFYQKMNDQVILQMSDEQYLHTVETEKMYDLFTKFYK